MRPIRTVAVFPTMFTLGNLVCGFFAIVVASRVDKPASALMDSLDVRNVMVAGWLIFLGMVFDALDGYVARLSKTSSDFGAQLDSLCDAVTFGVAPGFLLVKMCPRFTSLDHLLYDDAVWVIAAAFAACAALRLARFNVETGEEDDHLSFSGLPTPAAAAAIAGIAIMFNRLHSVERPLAYAEQIEAAVQTVLPFFAVLLALLMVSRIPYPHVTNQIFRGQRSFGHVVAVVFALVAVMVVPSFSLPIVCCAFALYGPVRLIWQKATHRTEQEEPLF